MLRPNVLILMTDQQSADAMSCVSGREHLYTPHLDALSERSVMFRRAYSPNPLCAPARASLFTGRYPHEIGLQTNDTPDEPDRFPCLGTYFRDAGYDTAYFGKWHFPIPYADTAKHGFDTIADADRSNGADLITPGLACSFLEAPRDRPFFLVASFNNPHNICEWARGTRELPDGPVGTPPPTDRCPPRRSNHAPTENEASAIELARRAYQAQPMFPVGDFGESDWREFLWGYYRMIESVDAKIGQVIDALKASGEFDRTVVLFLSDHGDCQGAHGWNQKTVFYEESARVPFILKAPGIDPGYSNALVNFGVDTLPTLAELTGIELPPGLPGRSVADDARGKDRESPAYVVGQNCFAQGAEIDGKKFLANGRMVRTSRYKYCVYSVGPQYESLYDLNEDPGETRNLAGETAYRNVLNQHRADLADFARLNEDHTAQEILGRMASIEST
ncbi:MAG: sulfatase-like hydrolase/transferase [Planctomycetota bacterium]